MFVKPKDYDTVQAYGEIQPIQLGGHIMTIMRVEIKKSKKGNDMLVIYADTAPEDKQPGYYSEQWQNDTRKDKKWGCIAYQVITAQDGSTSRGFKGFVTAVEDSNTGFATQWGEGFEECFKGKRVGAVFGEQDYLNNENELRTSRKIFSFRSVQAIIDGVDVPDRKELPTPKVTAGMGNPYTPRGQQGFSVIPTDDDLPF